MAVRLSPTERIAASLVKAGLSAHEAVELPAAHDAQVKAEAWDEGAEMGHRLYAESIYTIRARNPYRAAETEATR